MTAKAPAWDGIPENWGKGHYRDIPISKWVQKARERHIRDLKKSQTDRNFNYYFDTEEADRAVWFIENLLVHWKGKWAGKPFKLSAWQEWDIIRPLFGWKRKSDDTRRFRRALLMIARKNGKSSLLAAIGLYMLIADCEAGAQVFCAATKEDQAKIVWRDAVKFIKRSPALKNITKCLAKTIAFDALDAEMRPLGKDSDTQDGLDVHCGIIDEYHAHKDADMLGVLDSATGAREQPLIAIISTAGFEFESPCKEEQEIGEKLLDEAEGYEDETYFVYLCTIDDPEKWDCEEEWYKANPQLGISIKLEDFRNECNRAKGSPSRLANFKVKRLNIWLSAKDTWLPLDIWKQSERKVDWKEFEVADVFVAIDFGKTRDLTAMAVTKRVIDPTDPDRYKLISKVKHWCAEEGIRERSQEDRVPYEVWASKGWIEPTPGRATRSDYVFKEIRELSRFCNIVEVVVDPWNAKDFIQKAEDEGIKVFEHAQGMRDFAFPCRNLEDLVIECRLEHEENPVMDWQVGHCVVVRDGNDNMKIKKDESGDRVDGLVALVMSAGRAAVAPIPQEPVYYSRGIYYG